MMQNLKRAALSAAVLVPLMVGATGAGAQEIEAVYPDGIVPIAPYSPGIAFGDLLFVSGQIPHVDGGIPAQASDGVDDVKEQTAIVMRNVEAVLNEVGLGFENVLMVNVYLTDLANYGAFNEAYGPIWTAAGITPPARAAVEVGALPGSSADAQVLVEVSVIAGR